MDKVVMLHHFGDFLDRGDDYWTIIPNRERYAYRIGDVPVGSEQVTIVTIGREDENWSRVLTLPNLVEMTLHKPTKDQLEAISQLHSIKRLRMTHVKTPSIEFIRSMSGVEELVLEYVSGFKDLSPLQTLKRLRALHLENLRGVADFSGLSGIQGLKYLSIYGTLDWKQPIADFEFLRGIPTLEVLAMWQVISRKGYPALLPALTLRHLKKLRVHGSYLPVQEYALLEEGLQGVEGAVWGPYRIVARNSVKLPQSDIRAHLPEADIRANYPEVTLCFDGRRMIGDPDSRWVEFTGKGEGAVKFGTATAEIRCREFADRYDAMKVAARALINQEQGE